MAASYLLKKHQRFIENCASARAADDRQKAQIANQKAIADRHVLRVGYDMFGQGAFDHAIACEFAKRAGVPVDHVNDSIKEQSK